MLLPEAVERIEHNQPLDGFQRMRIFVGGLGIVGFIDLGEDGLADFVGGLRRDLFRTEADRKRHIRPAEQAFKVPFVRLLLDWAKRLHLQSHHFIDDLKNHMPGVVPIDNFVAEAVQDFALLVHHIVKFKRAFPNAKVVFFDAALGGLEGAV